MANNNHFNLNLDTIAPTGSITRPAQYLNANKNLTITRSSDDAVYMKVWRTTEAEGTKSDANYPTDWEAFSATKITDFTSSDKDGAYFYHLVLCDSVMNESVVYNTGEVVLDRVAPVIGDCFLMDKDTSSKTYTNDLTIAYSVAWTETNPLESITLSGTDIATTTIPATTASPATGDISFKDGTEDGVKTIKVTIVDKAGNSAEKNFSITLDTQLDKPVITLLDLDGNVITSGTYISFNADAVPSYSSKQIKVQITDADLQINAYRVYVGNKASEWVERTSGTKLDETVTITLPDGEGDKIIHGEVKDLAGSTAVADTKKVIVDNTKPVVSNESDKTIISNVSGYSKATLTLSGSDALAGIKSWDLLCGSVSIKGSLTDIPATFELTSANQMVEGSNTITLSVTDNAGNTNTAVVNVILDTTNPTVSIGTLNEWYTQAFDINVSTSDANKVASIQCWKSTVENDTTAKGTVVSDPAATQKVASDSIGGTFTEISKAGQWMHVKAVDSVGNVSYAHAAFGYDSVKPVINSFSFSKNAYSSATAIVNLTYEDATSGVAYMQITGDIDNPTTDWEEIASSKTVTLSAPDGMKTVTLKIKDNAGNVSEIKTATCELDTTVPSGTLTLYEADDATLKAAVSSVATFVIHLQITDDSVGKVYYKVWGDYTVGAQAAAGTTEPTDWTEYNKTAGKDYLVISGLSCTSGDGTKSVHAKAKDDAGNEITITSVSFVYDTTAPVVTVKNVTDNDISKVHVYRNSTTKYADEVKFDLALDSIITEFKVCAYLTQAQATAVTDIGAEVAVPMTAGSLNMSGTGTHQATEVISCLIKGTDYETALVARGGVAGDTAEGVHYVVAYVKDEAGTWSAVADFTA
jgi:hypothetical protein